MCRFRNKNRKPFVKQIAKKAPAVNHVTGDKIPKSFVFSRGKRPGPLKQLQMDLRKLMLPYTALKLKGLSEQPLYLTSEVVVRTAYTLLPQIPLCGNILGMKHNNLKDFLPLASGMNVTHFLILSKTDSAPYLRVAQMKQGPTLTFKIHKYSLAADIAQSQLRPRCPPDLFKTPPLIVLSGFGTGEQHLKVTTLIFQRIFPAIDINTVKLSSCQRIVLLNYDKETKLIEFRHYSIRLQPVGVSRRIRKFVQNHQVPDLRSLQDISDIVTKAGYGSESEADDEAATVNLSSDIGRVNRASTRSAVKLQEIGPRMTLQLVKIEEGFCTGGVLFNEYGNVNAKKSDEQESDEEMDRDEQENEDEEEQEVEDEEEQETEMS